MPRAPRSPAKYAPYRPFLPVPIASEAPGVTSRGATPLAMTPRNAPVAYPPTAFDRYAYGGGGLPSLPTRGRYGTTSAQLELHGREDARRRRTHEAAPAHRSVDDVVRSFAAHVQRCGSPDRRV